MNAKTEVRLTVIAKARSNPRALSVLGFSLLSAYLLSFLFEGQVLYGLLGQFDNQFPRFVLTTILAHFLGLATAGFFIKSTAQAKKAMIGAVTVSLVTTLPFYFSPSLLWIIGLIASGYSMGFAIAAWGYFLKVFTPGRQRLKTCADVLILSNVFMLVINVLALYVGAVFGLSVALGSLIAGAWFIWQLPVESAEKAAANENTISTNTQQEEAVRNAITAPLLLLTLFVFIVTINSGLMYQVVTPAFGHLEDLVRWYWALPYIVALLVVRNLPATLKRSHVLYAGMVSMMLGFVAFMLAGNGPGDYLLINTLMLGSFGVLDLFWWSILAQMLDYTENPARVFGIGLSANVLGVLVGDLLGLSAVSLNLSGSEVAVIALTVLCVTLALLPPLNQRLVLLLTEHSYLVGFDELGGPQTVEGSAVDAAERVAPEPLEPLTPREEEVLVVILQGRPNREVAQCLFISENTVKTHARNIYSKYGVSGRAELISLLLTGTGGPAK